MNSKVFLIAILSLAAFCLTRGEVANASTPATPLTFNLWEGISYPFTVSQIKAAQNLLRSGGYLDIPAATGIFGGKTKNAVKEYQEARGLMPTGIVGSLTRGIMNEEIAAGKKIKGNQKLRTDGTFAARISAIDEKILDVPLVEQEYPLSCEAASLQMALLYKGVDKSQDELIDLIGNSKPTVKYKDKKGSFVWGDPNEGFVGDIRGWMYSPRQGMVAATGWGVNKTPVARVAASFRTGSVAQTGKTIEDIIREISAGNPVIVWQYSPLPAKLLTLPRYKTLKGTAITFVPTHVNLVVGFRLGADGKYTFLINDPEYGRIEIGQQSFESVWSKYHNDMVVVK